MALGTVSSSAFRTGQPGPQFMPAPAVGDQTTTWRLFPATPGPAAATAFTGTIVMGTAFTVTASQLWFQGYWVWCCNSGQSTAAVKCALWSMNTVTTGTVVSGSTVTSGTLTAGTWNYIPLAAPIQLAVGDTMVAAFGMNNAFPFTASWWTAGGPGVNGITNGPLLAWSDQASSGGANASPWPMQQSTFDTTTNDPAAVLPLSTNNSFNCWVDVSVTNAAPATYAGSYRLFPNKAGAYAGSVIDNPAQYALATEIRLSAACVVNKIWFNSPNAYVGTAAVQLPTEVNVWSVTGNGLTGTSVYHDGAPSWSAAAGSGWVSVNAAGLVLQPGVYKVAVYNGAATISAGWSIRNLNFWRNGPGGNGIVWGPLSALGDAANPTTSYVYDVAGSANLPPYQTGVTITGQGAFEQCTPSLLVDPCDNFTAAPWTTGGSTVVSGSGHTGNAFSFPASSANTASYDIASGAQTARAVVGFWVNFTSLTGAAANFLTFRSDAGATIHTQIQPFFSGGTVHFLVQRAPSSSLGGGVNTGIGLNTWFYFEQLFTLSDTVGQIESRINGTSFNVFSSQDTKNAGTKTVYDEIRLQGLASTTFLVDDIYIRNDSTFGATGNLYPVLIATGTPPVAAGLSDAENFHVDLEVTPATIINAGGTGGILFDGTGVATVTSTGVGTGAIVFGGSGLATVTVNGVGSGAIVFNGSGTATVTVVGVGTGAIVFDGTGTATTAGAVTGTGNITFAGSGVATVTSTGVGTGNITFGGSGTGTVTVTATGTGAIGFGGSGTTGALVNGTGTGAIVFAGTGVATSFIPAVGTGAIVFNGAGTATAGPPPPFTVGTLTTTTTAASSSTATATSTSTLSATVQRTGGPQ